jgi:3-keto-disaccharide hydrolase
MPRRLISAVCFAALVSSLSFADDEWLNGINWIEPPIVTPGDAGSPPSDAIVLFDGTDLSAWEGGDQWIVEDGYATAAGDFITSRQKFGDCQLHLEFATPEVVDGTGQGRGNSGIYLMSRYEVQILDSYDNDTYYDGQCAAIYKQHPPLVNACRGPGEWQTYDIIFTAPRFNADGSLKSQAAVTILQNGVLVQNHFELQGSTSYVDPPIYHAHAEREPLQLQYHHDAVRFRNIWIRDLMPAGDAGEAESGVESAGGGGEN